VAGCESGCAALGVKREPIYPVLRGMAGDLKYGTNFAAYGSPARPMKVWNKDDPINVPFLLDYQHQWSERYKIRVWFYKSPIFNPDHNKCARQITPVRISQSIIRRVGDPESSVLWLLFQGWNRACLCCPLGTSRCSRCGRVNRTTSACTIRSSPSSRLIRSCPTWWPPSKRSLRYPQRTLHNPVLERADEYLASLQKLLTPVLYIPPVTPSLIMPIA
jgi:hypothetical protein